MVQSRTGAERYFAEQLRDRDYMSAYMRACARIEQVDRAIRLDKRGEQTQPTEPD